MSISRQNARAIRNRRVLHQPQFGLFIALIGLGLAIMTVFQLGRGSESEIALSEDEAVRGGRLYISYCAACHGELGQGKIIPEAPALDNSEHAWHHTDGQLQWIVLLGGERMPPFEALLSRRDAVLIIRFVQMWWTAEQFEAQQAVSNADPFIP